MKLCATVLLLVALAVPAGAAVVHNETVNGDLSSNAAAPTALVFAVGGNIVTGTVSNPGTPDRDYLTFTIPLGQILISLNLITFTPNNLGFAAFNLGATSFVPSVATAANFLAGIHPSGLDVGNDLMPLFVSSSVTGNSLSSANLPPGTYSFLIQQTNNIVQSYSLEFVIDSVVPTSQSTWGKVKSLYR